MNTRKPPTKAPSPAGDNSPVATVQEPTQVNDYLRLPRVLLSGCHQDMTLLMEAVPEIEGDDRAIRLKLLSSILNRPLAPPLVEVPVDENEENAKLRTRLAAAEKLLKECEQLVGTRVRHVIADSLEWRIGQFLIGLWPKAVEQ